MTKALRIAQLTLPSQDNDGTDLAPLHRLLKHELATLFGGYTAFETSGGWVDRLGNLIEDDSTTYQVAFDMLGENVVKFTKLVREYGRSAHQEAMFYVIDGIAYVEAL